MNIDAKFYMHDSDRIALQALQAIPGFTQLFKAFMKVWSEKQFRIQNMSTNLRISEKQLPKYYNMLPPICEKLGIEVPELYLQLDVNPNAYTAGDTKPFIVITSGLIETMPEELIPTVLAHECGHIACRHCLYSTMGRIILSEAVGMLGLDGLAILPIQMAFSYWMRCSELSADRAAALCDGSSDGVVEMCMRFAGCDKDIVGQINVEEFMNQALEYQQMIEESAWDKTLEFMMLTNVDHPFNAVRARECYTWAQTDRFATMRDYIHCGKEGDIRTYLKELPIPEASRDFLGEDAEAVMEQLRDMGFDNITLEKVTQRGLFTKSGQVTGITLNGQEGFKRYGWYPADSRIVIEYYEAQTEEEAAAAHPGELRIPDSSWRYINRLYHEVIEELRDAGFRNIETQAVNKGKKGLFGREGAITRISVNGHTRFEKGEWFMENSIIRITIAAYDEE